MKIKSIELHPFAGIQDKEFEFSDGLNLLLGPNEAGKSSIFHAISHGLLTKTNLVKKDFNKYMRPYLPVGGDVIRVTLKVYEDDPDSFSEIQKTWKPGLRNGEAKMVMPDGTEIVDEDAIQDTIENLLPTTPSTMREVLLSRQSELHNIMDKMQGQAEVQQELSGILRQNVMEAGGISVDKFQQKIEEAYDEYFKRWNRETQYPEQDASGRDRGIQNPYAHPKGVLKAWYKKEKAQKRYEDVLEYEKRLDELNQQLEEIESELIEKEQKRSTWAPIADQLSQRKGLQKDLKFIDERLERIKKISTKWLEYESDIEQKKPALEEFDEQLQALSEEQEKAAKKAEITALKKRVEKLDSIKGDIKEANKDLEEAKAVSEEDLKSIRSLKSTIRDLETTIQASKLKLQLTARKDIEIMIRDVNGEPQSHTLEKGQELTVTQDGLITIETENIEATVTSATGNLDEVVAKLSEKKDKLTDKLDKLDVDSMEDAASQHELYKNYQQKVAQAESRYQDELGGDTYEQLVQKLEEAGDMEAVRELGEITEERDEVQDQRNDLRNELKNMQEKLNEWKEEFDGKIENVIDKWSELRSNKAEINEQLEELPDLPDEFESFEKFQSHLSEIEQSIEQLNQRRASVREERAELMGGAPDQTSNELEERYQELVAEFERINRKAESIARVKEETDNLLADLEDDTYQPLVESFTGWLQTMSNGRYQSVEQEAELPEGFVTAEGKTLKFAHLSHGTKDLAALAWKLTATEYFLADKKSLLLLDDPLVDMDPQRREQAAEALHKFAEEHQVLVFSCHPYYRDVLEEKNLISLS